MSGPTATVVICAYTEDRWDDIVAAVASVRAQDVADGVLVEVLVVVDHRPVLLERARTRFTEPVRVLPNVRRQGLSGARNSAVAAARGDVVVFLDDDATARPGWLAALLAPYTDPEVVAVGGVAHPRFPSRRAGGNPARPWLLPSGGAGPDATGELDWIVGCTYTGQPTRSAEVRNLMGCNMSVRRAVLADVGGFAEDLGRIGRNPLGCEETELCIRARQAYRRAGRPPGGSRPRALVVPAAAELVGGAVEGGGGAPAGQRRRAVDRTGLRRTGAAPRGGAGVPGGPAGVRGGGGGRPGVHHGRLPARAAARGHVRDPPPRRDGPARPSRGAASARRRARRRRTRRSRAHTHRAHPHQPTPAEPAATAARG
jgi:hypothetical protein